MGLRTLAERMSQGVVLKRRLPQAFGGGRLFVAPRGGGMRYWRRNMMKMDPHLFGLADEFVKPGMCVWDIGANMGLFTFAAANRAGREGFVLAVEADVDNAALLLRSRFASDRAATAELQVLTVAMGAPGARFAHFVISDRSRAMNSLEGFGMGFEGPPHEKRVVPVVTCDELLASFRAPGFVKIDVEGAELEVFKGAEKLLSEVRPVFELEVAPVAEKQEAIREVFSRHHYKMYDGDVAANGRLARDLPPFSCLAMPE